MKDIMVIIARYGLPPPRYYRHGGFLVETKETEGKSGGMVT